MALRFLIQNLDLYFVQTIIPEHIQKVAKIVLLGPLQDARTEDLMGDFKGEDRFPLGGAVASREGRQGRRFESW